MNVQELSFPFLISFANGQYCGDKIEELFHSVLLPNEFLPDTITICSVGTGVQLSYYVLYCANSIMYSGFFRTQTYFFSTQKCKTNNYSYCSRTGASKLLVEESNGANFHKLLYGNYINSGERSDEDLWKNFFSKVEGEELQSPF